MHRLQVGGALSPLGGRGRARRLGVVAAIAALVVAADQLTKDLAVDRLADGPRHLLGPLSLQLEYNRGVAFSLLNGVGAPVLAIVVAVIALLGLFASKVSGALGTLGVALVLGGAISNLGDRLFRSGGAVVDFIHTTFWPTFNLADAAIVVGAALLAIAFWRGGPETASEAR